MMLGLGVEIAMGLGAGGMSRGMGVFEGDRSHGRVSVGMGVMEGMGSDGDRSRGGVVVRVLVLATGVSRRGRSRRSGRLACCGRVAPRTKEVELEVELVLGLPSSRMGPSTSASSASD
jgi:hypothetical protein